MVSRLLLPLKRLRRKLIFAVWSGRCARQGAGVLVVCGAAVLIARVALDLELEQALWLLAPLALVPFTAWIGVRERVPSEAGAAAWLDLRSGAQGTLLADYETGDERWSASLERQLDRLPELPALRLSALARPFLPALAFALLALFVPISRATAGPSTEYFDRTIEGLANQLDVLKEVANLDEATAEELTRRVEELAANVDPTRPEAMLEAIDSLRKALGIEGQDAALVAKSLLDNFGAIASDALANSDLGKELLSGQLKQALDSGLLKGALQNLDTLAPELQEFMKSGASHELKLPSGLSLSPEQMRALSEAARAQLAKSIGELNLAGLAKLANLKLGDNQALLRELIEKFHKHNDECKKPGGT